MPQCPIAGDVTDHCRKDKFSGRLNVMRHCRTDCTTLWVGLASTMPSCECIDNMHYVEQNTAVLAFNRPSNQQNTS